MTRSLGIQGGNKIYVQALDQERLNNNIGKSSTSCITWLKDFCYDSNSLYSLLLVVHESWLEKGTKTDGNGQLHSQPSNISNIHQFPHTPIFLCEMIMKYRHCIRP